MSACHAGNTHRRSRSCSISAFTVVIAMRWPTSDQTPYPWNAITTPTSTPAVWPLNVAIDIDQRRIVLSPPEPPVAGIDAEFARQLDEFIVLYRPALEALAK